ncbi:MAG: adenylate/guanylate cyclase domain-containing protein [Geminicoccaceae bacterium]
MATTRAERRLAAILAADVVGYSRLVEQDEAATLAALRDLRHEVFDPLLAEHRGRVVKLMGDGVLAEFGSAVDAVACAAALQRAVTERQAGVPAERRIVLRVGVNLGDVVVEEDGDLLGDGVNIAARLEAAARPGEIYLSGKVHDEVRGRLDLGFEDQGELALKNITNPVRAWRVAGATAARQEGTIASPSPRPALAVLPFAEPGGDPGQRYFGDGFTEDLITELSRFRQLSVLSPATSFRYRDFPDLKRVGRKLGVEHVVDGSIRRLGERVRITARLVNASTGDQLWAERFDREQRELFEVQDELVRTIVATLVGRLQAADLERARRKPPASLAAYECVLRGTALGDAEAIAEGRRLFERAVELDPTYGRAHARLAHSLYLEWYRDPNGPDALLERALGHARKAVELDENDNVCQDLLGWIYQQQGSFDLAEHHKRRALELNPNSPEQTACTGVLYTFLGRPEEAVRWFERARQLDPYFEPAWYWPLLGVAHFVAGRYAKAVALLGRSPTMPVWVRVYLAACNALLGDREQARTLGGEVMRLVPDFSSTGFAAKERFKRSVDQDCLLKGLRAAGLPE